VKRELKRRIKQDEFVSGFEHAWALLSQHRREVQVVVAVVLVVALGSWGVLTWRQQRTAKAEQAFAAALEIFDAPVTAELPLGAPPPTGTAYPTAVEKFRKAAAAFDEVARSYASQPAGLRALYYAGLSRMRSGETAEAEKQLSEVAARREPGALAPALARLALGELFRDTGRTDQAVESFRQIVDDTQAQVPRDYALISLAGTLEEARRPAEARAAYERLVREFPASSYAGEARRRAAFLQTAASS